MPLPPSVWRTVSPDGRLMVIADSADPLDPAGCGQAAGGQGRNRLFLVDLVSGDQRLLRDCDATIVPSEWVDNRHDALKQYGPEYEGMPSRVLLLDVATGELRPLVPGFAYAAYIVAAPDRSQFLVTGNRLRLLDTLGTLLREIERPLGMEIAEAVWSPDGSEFVYTARTQGLSLYE